MSVLAAIPTLFTSESMRRVRTAITTQHRLTYGLSRSPILAHFQKIPNTLAEHNNQLLPAVPQHVRQVTLRDSCP